MNIGDRVRAYKIYDANYLTAGKEYEVTAVGEFPFDGMIAFDIVDDDGDTIHCLSEGCYHIGGHWTLVTAGDAG